MEWDSPPLLPSLNLPEAPGLPGPVLGLPKAELPSYKPMVVPPSVLRAPPGIEGADNTDKAPQKEAKTQVPPATAPTLPPLPPEAQIVEIPFTEVELPLPSTIIMTTAVTTAFISVGATLIATSLFKYIVMIMKPVFKQAWNKLTKKKQVQEIS
tara:strand:- start:76 stop:537 length:462 start_codon:yes stop_codon:yes gene_type:complete